MSLLEETIAEFGRSLGMQDLRPRSNGSVVLAIQNLGTLSIDVAGISQEAALVSLTKPLAQGQQPRWERQLSFTHYKARLSVPVQLGTLRDHRILSVVLPQEELTLPKLNEIIHVLDRQHQLMEDSP